MVERDPLAISKAENARLIALLEANGIQWRTSPELVPPASTSEPSRLSTDEKVALFRRLFRGRTDVYPIRWENKTTAKSGYSPACANEWRAGVCEKPRIKCGDCSNRLLIPLSDAVLYGHLAGEHTVGVYPLLQDDTCYFLAIDFDEAEWREDARAFVQRLRAEALAVALGSLDGRSRRVIEARWLREKGPATLRDLATEFKVSAERIRQIEARALQTMRGAMVPI